MCDYFLGSVHSIQLSRRIASNSSTASARAPSSTTLFIKERVEKVGQNSFTCGSTGAWFTAFSLQIQEYRAHIKTSGTSRGGGHGAQATPSFLDQTEARTAGKKVLETAPSPASLRVWMTGLPLPASLSQGLDLALKTGINGLVN